MTIDEEIIMEKTFSHIFSQHYIVNKNFTFDDETDENWDNESCNNVRSSDV